MYLLFFIIFQYCCFHFSTFVQLSMLMGKLVLFSFPNKNGNKQQTTLLHITNNTINNSKPTATTIVKAQRKQVNFNSGIFQESVERLPGPKPEAKSQRKQKSQQSRHEKLQKLEKRTKTTEKYREIPAQPSFSTMLQAYLGSHTVTQSGPPKNSKILWVT